MTAPCPALGFVVSMHFASSLTDGARAELRKAWLGVLEERGLECEGADSKASAYVVSSEAAQATEDDRVAIVRWLADLPQVAESEVGPLVDLRSV